MQQSKKNISFIITTCCPASTTIHSGGGPSKCSINGCRYSIRYATSFLYYLHSTIASFLYLSTVHLSYDSSAFSKWYLDPSSFPPRKEWTLFFADWSRGGDHVLGTSSRPHASRVLAWVDAQGGKWLKWVNRLRICTGHGYAFEVSGYYCWQFLFLFFCSSVYCHFLCHAALGKKVVWCVSNYLSRTCESETQPFLVRRGCTYTLTDHV